MIFLILFLIILGSVTFSFYKQSKALEVNPTKWVLIGVASFLFITIPAWVIIISLINEIFSDVNVLASIFRIVIFIIISGFVRRFVYKRMERESKVSNDDENLLDDMNF